MKFTLDRAAARRQTVAERLGAETELLEEQTPPSHHILLRSGAVYRRGENSEFIC